MQPMLNKDCGCGIPKRTKETGKEKRNDREITTAIFQTTTKAVAV